MKTKMIIMEIVTLLIIMLFVYAAFSKLIEFDKFKIELNKSPVLNIFSDFIAIAIPILELCIAIILMMRKLQVVGLYLSFMLMVIFSGYIFSILKFSEYIPCSCGGILQNMSWYQHLIFNLVIVVLCAIAILISPYKNQDLIRDKKRRQHS